MPSPSPSSSPPSSPSSARRLAARIFLPAVLLAMVIALASNAPRPAGAQGQIAKGSSVTCSFSNPGYSGFCRQTQSLGKGASAAKVCTTILGCLNDVRCVKTYCDATAIRGNWKLESVETSVRP